MILMRCQIILLASSALLFSCSKSSGDNMSPVIVINSPTDKETVAADAVVVVSGRVTDDDEIHEVHLDITNKTTNDVLHYHFHPDAKNFDINESFTAASGTSYHIQVEADDHSGNTNEKEIEIHCE
jgi:hypothetical protein